MRVRRAAAAAILAGGVLFAVAPRGAASHSDPKPKTVTAWYMDTVADSTLYDMGCAQANRVDRDVDPDTGAVILAFGSPVTVSGAGNRNGASLFRGDDASVDAILDAGKDYSRGFVECLDKSATQVQYTLALGVSNLYPSGWGGDRIEEHGRTWGRMVADLRLHQVDRGWSDRILSAGAADLEPGWAGPTRTRRWVNAYDGVPNSSLLWNFGSADGCPKFGDGGTACNNGWGQGDIYYVSWEAPAGVPAPQIYRNDGAQAEQWVLVSKWGAGKMYFRGPLSQKGACNQVGCDTSVDNTPGQRNVSTLLRHFPSRD